MGYVSPCLLYVHPGRHYFSADFKLRGAHSHQARLSIDMATFAPNAMRNSARLLRNPSDRFFCLRSSAMIVKLEQADVRPGEPEASMRLFIQKSRSNLWLMASGMRSNPSYTTCTSSSPSEQRGGLA